MGFALPGLHTFTASEVLCTDGCWSSCESSSLEVFNTILVFFFRRFFSDLTDFDVSSKGPPLFCSLSLELVRHVSFPFAKWSTTGASSTSAEQFPGDSLVMNPESGETT